PRMAATPTLRTLAAALGVSPSTVSRALDGHPHVDEATRRRVVEAARRAGYAPNALAQGLRTQRTRRIGLVVPDIQNDFYAAAAAAIERELAGRQYRLQLSITGDDPALEQAYLDGLRQEHVAGVIYVPCGRRSAAAARLVASGVPVAELARRSQIE